MTGTCIHGFATDGCLICRTLRTGDGSATDVAVATSPRHNGEGRSGPHPDRTSAIHHGSVDASVARGPRRHRSIAGSLALVVVALLAVGAAAWILTAVVFTILHVLELIVVGFGCGWVGYRIGLFRGARHPRPRT